MKTRTKLCASSVNTNIAFSIRCIKRNERCPYNDADVPEDKTGSPDEPDPNPVLGQPDPRLSPGPSAEQLPLFGLWPRDGGDMTGPNLAVVRGAGSDLDGENYPLPLPPNEAFAPSPQGDFNADGFGGMDTNAFDFLGSQMLAAKHGGGRDILPSAPRRPAAAVAVALELDSLEKCRHEVPLPSLHQDLPGCEVLTPPPFHFGYFDCWGYLYGLSQTPATGRIGAFSATTPSQTASSGEGSAQENSDLMVSSTRFL
ncbi:hypothetical protein N658DRAFT_65540 [Parathielavia hyrcaniae]|uniref:Uncharacterized protein n=1 Tax=Parathielavia hyrcaniae TaxID=113614 RepID=A0AAN6PS56_9PEZI|nr:hypothetical protein N658DRAFT_65540 [Parathielavia hyrcaniae]